MVFLKAKNLKERSKTKPSQPSPEGPNRRPKTQSSRRATCRPVTRQPPCRTRWGHVVSPRKATITSHGSRGHAVSSHAARQLGPTTCTSLHAVRRVRRQELHSPTPWSHAPATSRGCPPLAPDADHQISQFATRVPALSEATNPKLPRVPVPARKSGISPLLCTRLPRFFPYK